MLQEIVSYYSKSEASPQGVAIDKPFMLPSGIREIQLAQGQPSWCSRPDPSGVRLSSTPLQFLKGVGPRRAADLERVGLITVEDCCSFSAPLRRSQPVAQHRQPEPGHVSRSPDASKLPRPDDAAAGLQDFEALIGDASGSIWRCG
jgi:hypothetical protein